MFWNESYNEGKEYRKALDIIEESEHSSEKFTLDTCILVNLAFNNDTKKLNDILHHFRFIFTNVNYYEILNLIKKRDLHHGTLKILAWFLHEAVSLKKAMEVDFSEFENELKPLVFLLPRKLVHMVLISDYDSFVNILIRRFSQLLQKLNSGSLMKSDYDSLKISYKRDEHDLQKRLEQKFKSLCEKLEIDIHLINLKKYFESVNNFKAITLHEIKEIIKKSRGNLNDAVLNLRILASKTYTGDVRYVAETLAHSARPNSLDSDVIILLELHSLRYPHALAR